MKKFALMAGALALLTVPSCIFIDDDIGNCVNGSGNQVSEELVLPAFTGVALSINADVYIEQGAEQKVVVTAQQNIIDLIELDVHDGVWDISFDGCAFSFSDVKITITVPEIEKLVLTSSGNIYGIGQLETNLIDLVNTGSGEIDLDLVDTGIDATITGSGDIQLSGQTQSLGVVVTGSGDFEAFGLEAEDAVLTISGSGDIECTVTGDLKVTISGSGDVYYKGNPSIDVTISGSGKLIDAN